MKKLLVGCGVVLLVFGIAGAGVGYYLYQQVRATVGQFAELAQVPAIERGIRNQASFTPPASGSLDEAQVERLLRVQSRIREHLGAGFEQLELRYKGLLERQQANALDLPQIVAMYRDLAATWVDAKRTQVEALNEVGFSMDEYRWVRERAYAAVGMPFLELDLSRLSEMGDAWSEWNPAMLKGARGPDESAVNADWIAAFREKLEEHLPLAALGL